MFGERSEPTDTHDADAIALQQAKKGESGITYALYRKVMEEGGSEQLIRVGTVFMRGSGSGGVAFVTGDDGKKYELPLMLIAETRVRQLKVRQHLSAQRETVELKRPAAGR